MLLLHSCVELCRFNICYTLLLAHVVQECTFICVSTPTTSQLQSEPHSLQIACVRRLLFGVCFELPRVSPQRPTYTNNVDYKLIASCATKSPWAPLKIEGVHRVCLKSFALFGARNVQLRAVCNTLTPTVPKP